MECPICKHQAAPTALVKCSECGWAFERQLLEEYEHLDYLLRWLNKHEVQIGENEVRVFKAETVLRKTELEKLMHLHAEPEKPIETVVPVVEKPVAPQPVPIPEPRAVPAAVATPQPASAIVSTPLPKLTPIAPTPVPAPLPKPVAPSKPAQPPINWGKIWDNTVNFVVSGALLRALLYLGAFMIVVSAAVLVINFWNIFPPILQIVFIFALPTAFYAGGWFIRARLKLAQAGMVITGVGAVLLAVDFAALYQLTRIQMNIDLYWFIAALITTAIYVFTAYRLTGEFFDYLMFLGGINLLLALTRVLHLPLEWTISTVPLAGAGMTALAARLWPRGDFWRDTAHAARYLPQVLTPFGLGAILFVTTPQSDVGKMTAFLLATITYGVLAWKFPSVWQLALSLLGLTAATTFGVRIFDAQGWWLPTAGAILSAGYVLTGWKLFDQAESQFAQKNDYRLMLYLTGFALSVLVFGGGLAAFILGKNLEAALALTILALSFCAWNLLLRQPVYGYIGALLLLPAYWIWLDLAQIQRDFFPLAYLIFISAVHLPAGILFQRVEGKFAQPFRWVGWGVSFLILLAVFSLQESISAWLPPLTLTLLTVYYIFNAWYFRQSFFAWITATVFPLAAGLWIGSWELPNEQAALIWAGLAYAYLFVERFLQRQKQDLEMRLPFGLGTILLALIGIGVALTAFFLRPENGAPLTLISLALPILLTILAARLYRSRWPLYVEPALAALLAVLVFIAYGPNLLGKALTFSQYGLVLCGVAWVHLLVAAALDRFAERYSHGLYFGGYGLVTLSTLATIADLPALLWALGAFIVAMGASFALVYFNRHQTWTDLIRLFGTKETTFIRLVRGACLWPAVWLFPIWCVLLLIHLKVPNVFCWLGLSLPAWFYLFAGLRLAKRDSTYSWPFSSAAQVFITFAICFSADRILILAFRAISSLNLPTFTAADTQILIGQGFVQLSAVVFYIAWAWLKRQSFFAHVASWLSLLPLTALLLLLPGMTARIIIVAWSGWAALLLVIGFLLDRLKEGAPRHAYGPYLAGYLLAAGNILWTLSNLLTLLWTLGIFILVMAASATLAYSNRHRTWNDFAQLFGAPETTFVCLVRGAFLWPVAWLFPIWCALLLEYLKVPVEFRWLAIGLPALLYLFVGTQLAKRDSTYSWPFSSAAHVFTVIALVANSNQALSYGMRVALARTLSINAVQLPAILAQGLVLLITVLFYAAWAQVKRQRFFAHLASWLSILPFTSLLLLLPGITANLVLISWVGWAAWLLLIGFLLDRLKNEPLRLAHGPYFAGYALAIAMLLASIPDRWLNVVILGFCILLAKLSAISVHFKQHRSFEDFINFFWHSESLFKRGARLFFLFFAAYAAPIWVMQLEAYYRLSPAWQGVSLALLAPLYIAAGLFLRRFNRDYTWPFYSAGYALTVLGAMIAFDDQRLAIYVLALDVAVYAASAVIFRQPFWLYLATCLAPITVLIALDYNDRFTTQWIGWAFTVFGFLYFCLGQFLDRRKTTPLGVDPYALPLYAPGYLLSAIALALASGDKDLALVIYPANILLYALSAWRFREPLFLYPTTWLSIVPYYLFVTKSFTIPFEWQGLVWLPQILVFIALGRFVFHRQPLDLKSPRAILHSLAHPAIPFYLMAYALTVTMLLGSRWTPLSLTVAAATATALYFASALLFRHPAWLYPTLFTAHLTILSYFAIHPSDSPARYITLPFLALTWFEALAGYFVSRRFPVTETTASGRLVFKFFGREFDFGTVPSIGFLTIPSWAQPIFIVVTIDTVLWESLALSGLDTGLWVSAGFFLLFALFTLLWQDQLLAHLALGFGWLAVTYQFRTQGLTVLQVFSGFSGIALGLYLLSWLVEWLRGVFLIWRRPLVNFAVGLSALALLVTLPTVFTETISAALTLGFAGALYLTISLRRRTYLLGYFGMGLLIAGWSLFLFVRNVAQPQVYAIPAGLYFVGLGFFERRRHPGRFALIIESLGLALLLVTSLIQSLNGETGFPYFLLLLVEGLLVGWWGAARHLRVPFVIGLTAGVVNVLAQVVVLVRVYDVNRWLIIFGVGILLVGLGIFVERRREQLLSRAQDFRDMLERWD